MNTIKTFAKFDEALDEAEKMRGWGNVRVVGKVRGQYLTGGEIKNNGLDADVESYAIRAGAGYLLDDGRVDMVVGV
jgi:hypothetical protein